MTFASLGGDCSALADLATGAAGPGPALPAPGAEHGSDLGGDSTGAVADVVPLVAKRHLAAHHRQVVHSPVPAGGAGCSVDRPTVEFHRGLVLVVVDILVGPSYPSLTGTGREVVSSLDVHEVSAFQRRMRSSGHVPRCREEFGPPTQVQATDGEFDRLVKRFGVPLSDLSQ